MRKFIWYFLISFIFFTHHSHAQKLERLEGKASYYGTKFHGKKTASGEIFNMHKMTAAHPKLPFNTLVRVTNKVNNKSVIVRINDRGPFVKNRIIDLSKAAAKQLDMVESGTVHVKLEILEPQGIFSISPGM